MIMVIAGSQIVITATEWENCVCEKSTDPSIIQTYEGVRFLQQVAAKRALIECCIFFIDDP